MTYSIVARDAQTGAFGVAVQSHYFNVGALVPWLEAGVGAVATQAFVSVAYGPRGLDAMRGGANAADALSALTAADTFAAVRQVAMVDAQGRVGSHTGASCIAYATSRVGTGVVCQANMMRRDGVADVMLETYTGSSMPFASRLVDALDAAEGHGGDIRGRQSAAIRIVAGSAASEPAGGLVCDLRVEDHPDPNRELRRLVGLHAAYTALSRSDELRISGDPAAADAAAWEAVSQAPDNVEIGFWWAIELAKDGRDAEARPLFDRAFAADPGWRELVERLAPSGLLPDDSSLVRRILAAG
jgi:uncharacterized Ntn-hydrolase superfamily protein